MVELTKDARKALALLYTAYKKRRASGMGKTQASYLDTYGPEFADDRAQIIENRRELQSAGLISVDIVGGVQLKDRAIIYMENKTANTIKEWLSFGAQFIP